MIYNRRYFLRKTGLIGGGLFVLNLNSQFLFAQSTSGRKGKTYYIDPELGDDANDGLSSSTPLKTYATREFTGGDTILFKRGSVIRDILHTQTGKDGAPITYGAYGKGAKPTFLGSVAIGDSKQWVEVQPSIWKYKGTFASKVCNLVFDGGLSCGNMRWNLIELKQQGEWHYSGNSTGDAGGGQSLPSSVLYLCSSTNPGNAYRDIECVLWGQRKLVGGNENIILENLCFRNSGVHGYQESHVRNVVIRDCEFRFIGGAVWSSEKRIRFGNAVELWDGARNIIVERCTFDNIYDSAVTHQGGGTRHIPEKLYFRNNRFSNYGMSAYECREPSQEVYFEGNTCTNAGCGFSMQGEKPPRQSEIYPQPMGHHVFIWRIDPGTQLGHIYIRNNIFCEAPYGAAIYSIIDPADEQKFILDHNHYRQTTGDLLIHFGGRSYKPSEFACYQNECNQDKHSKIEKPE